MATFKGKWLGKYSHPMQHLGNDLFCLGRLRNLSATFSQTSDAFFGDIFSRS